ncbi:MAG: permease [Pseudomonadota bacterium]
MQRVLSLDQSPPLRTVLRFFLGTPLFLLLAGALLAWQGEAALQSRWAPATLALTHLFTLGALGMSMAGALIQILPVVAGVVLPRARVMAPAVHALLGTGTLALAAGFLMAEAWLFQAALALLVPALSWLCGCVIVALWQPQAEGAAPMLATVRLALGALVITVALGALLASSFGRPGAPSPLPMALATDLHAMWGVLGWAGLLVTGVAFQVVPMFQVTPLYPVAVHQRLGVAVFLLLVASSISAPIALTLLMLAYACFAGVTLSLLARRKRPEPDAMTLFWCMSMLSLAGCFALWLVPGTGAGRTLALGVLALVGFLYSAINGMLYKIVPFLVWHHLQERAAPGQRAPGVKHIIPDARAQRQFWMQAAALALLLAACWFPAALARPAGVALAASALWLAWNLVSALRIAALTRPASSGNRDTTARSV